MIDIQINNFTMNNIEYIIKKYGINESDINLLLQHNNSPNINIKTNPISMLDRYKLDMDSKMSILNGETPNKDIIMKVYDNFNLFTQIDLDLDLKKYITVIPKKNFLNNLAKNIDEFRSRLDILTNNQLKNVEWDSKKFVIAGGIVNSAFMGDYDCIKSDIDIFVINNEENCDKEFANIATNIFNSLDYKKKVYKTDTTINILGTRGTSNPDNSVISGDTQYTNLHSDNGYHKPIQLPLKVSKNIEQLLLFFDMDCVSIAYDGYDLWMTWRYRDSICSGYNLLSNDKMNSKMYVDRVLKYTNKGYGFCIFEMPNGYDTYVCPNQSMYLMPLNYPYYIEDITDTFNMEYRVCDDISDIVKGKLVNSKWSDKTLLIKENIIKCYMCKHYIQYNVNCMCDVCYSFNQKKKMESKNLSGQYAIVTGGRVKIGYYTALKLLRSGANVLVTTRFPNDALGRFEKEVDYNEWNNRLTIYSLDMRHMMSIVKFIDYVIKNFNRLDILINNAAQTVKRSPQYYRHLVEREIIPHTTCSNHIKGEYISESNCGSLKMLDFAQINNINLAISKEITNNMTPINNNKLPLSVALSVTHFGDEKIIDNTNFPPNEYDNDGQQVDIRNNNSWNANIDDLSLVEILEVQIINNVAPTMFVSKFKELMVNNHTNSKHIINIQSPEGMFSIEKSAVHPHTNMAKSALNQLTQTIANDFIKDNIYVNSVDVGWSTSCLPTFIHPPLVYEDSVARIMDPIFNENHYGKLLKDYKIYDW